MSGQATEKPEPVTIQQLTALAKAAVITDEHIRKLEERMQAASERNGVAMQTTLGAFG